MKKKSTQHKDADVLRFAALALSNYALEMDDYCAFPDLKAKLIRTAKRLEKMAGPKKKAKT
jgi:hypothetical protein